MNLRKNYNISEIIETYSGLSEKEAASSRRSNGENVLESEKKNTFIKDLLANFGDPIIKVLLCALAINFIMLFKSFNLYESIGIIFAILLATVISTVSERGSELAFEKLKKESEKSECRVKRNGRIKKLAVAELAVGDIVILSAGEQIPADGEIMFGVLNVDESALTGESKEKEKRAGGEGKARMLYMGSVVYSGEAVVKITAVGAKTYYGTLAKELTAAKRESPLKHRLSRLAATVSKLGFAAALLVALASLFNAFIIDSGFESIIILSKIQSFSFTATELLRAFTLAITVIVVAVPEGLPMMITVVLSKNMKKMLADNVLVRKLVGIETAGSLNILFTDKTGTLTEGRLSLSSVILGDTSEYACKNMLSKHKIYEYFNESAKLNTESFIDKGKAFGGNSTDRALYNGLADAKKPIFRAVEKIHFDSRKKYSAVKASNGLWYIKGAPELILAKCTDFYDCDGNRNRFKNKDRIYGMLYENTKNAVRVIAIATSSERVTEGNIPEGLTLVGLCGLKDKIRREAKSAVEKIKKSGVQLVMLTGDSKETAVAIAKECGIIEKKDDSLCFTSEEMNKLSDRELKEKLPYLRVVSRALPSDKTKLVKLSEELGLVTGMTGDGINDSPALKKADVGFAMGSGCAVAKEAGDIVITDNNFASIVKAVLYGRTIFKSIRKFITFQLTMNFCAVGISLIGPFIGVDTPVTVMQMLWINIIMDTLGGLAFAGEPAIWDYMEEKPKSRSCPIINKYMLGQIVCMVLYTISMFIGFFTLPFFKYAFDYYENPLNYMTAFFALFIFSGIFNCLNARTPRINIFSNVTKNLPFLVIMGGISIIQIVLIYFGGSLFRAVPLDINRLLGIILLAATVIPVDMLRKAAVKARGIEREV